MRILTDSFSLRMLPNELCVRLRSEQISCSDIPNDVKSFVRDVDTAKWLTESLGLNVELNYAEVHMDREDEMFVVVGMIKTDFKFYRITITDCKNAADTESSRPVTYKI
ncbi:MAG: hypothetical protein K2H53_07135 [Clostridia bacterium]|nr:hypothetical protein [Clostridia bacterium]